MKPSGKNSNSSASYMRAPVPADKVGQCSCCLLEHRSTKRGTLVRHGWRESGRVVGQFGQGFQFGACHGGSLRPLEQTDADAVVILARLEESLARLAESVEDHTVGLSEYSWEYERVVYSFETADRARLEEFLNTKYSAVIATDRSRREQGHRVYYRPTRHLSITVPRGTPELTVTKDVMTARAHHASDHALTVPSYETLRAGCIAALKVCEAALTAQRAAIQAAIKHHFENPSNGKPDNKRRTKVCHWRRITLHEDYRTRTTVSRSRIACGSRALGILASELASEVTCSRCAKHANDGQS